MFIETMDGEMINTAHLRSISIVTGLTAAGSNGFGITGFYAGSALFSTESAEEATVFLGYYPNEKDATAEFELLQEALIANREIFRCGQVYA